MNNESIKLLDMFACCEKLRDMCGGLENAVVGDVTVNRERLYMELCVTFARIPAPAEKKAIEDCIAAEYGMGLVSLRADYPRQEAKQAAVKKKAVKKPPAQVSGDVLYGKMINGRPMPMSELNRESGNVIVRGEVFAVESREIAKIKGAVLQFDITDNTNSMRVSKFFRSRDDKSVIEKINKGMFLSVEGSVCFDRYHEDIIIEPRNIVISKKPMRQDKAPEKRVELHMHTRYSTLDALADPGAIVARAAAWGHRAVAITDHGVAQAFPEAWHAADKNEIKIIYGVEGYYINDVDERPVVVGDCDRSLHDEFVAFDIETTGLNQTTERMTEIGAVIFRDGQIGERFQTFVNPEKPIPPQITELTGITDRDVFDAPSEESALKDFIAFVGGRPVIAHNADFDTGFMAECAERCGIDFDPVIIDSLPLARCLLPDLKRFKLDIVAGRLGLPEFHHHRASDDAAVVARMMEKFIPMLENQGAQTVDDIERITRQMRNNQGGRVHTKHIILLVKNKIGLKNLYELISKAHLEHFNRFPIMPKSLILQHRDGLIIGSACEAGEVFESVFRRYSRRAQRRIAAFYDYLEIQPICNNSFMVANGSVADDEGLRDLNRRIVALGEETGKPVAATGDVHFLDPEDEIYRHILLASKKFSDADRDLPIYFKTTDEMLSEFSYLGEDKCREVVLTVPNAIADAVETFDILPRKTLFPPEVKNSAEDLKRLVYGKMRELYGENPPEIVTSRVETELGDILGRNYDVIYMSAQKLVADSLAHGYLVGSRGSVGSSLVAFMSGITEVNSLPAHYRCPECKHADFESGKGYGCGADMPDKTCPVCGAKYQKDGFDIPFETFLGFGGDKVPDIDLNFSGEYQANAHKYTEELFGRDHVFRAGTIGTLAEKTAYGYVKKYLAERNMTVTKAEENRLAAGCVGVKRTTGQHPGGLVIIPQNKDVTDFCPVQRPADSVDTDVITTHFEYHSMEDNLLKLDMLGHDDPTMIRMLEDLTGVDAQKISLDDSETMLLFRSAKPLGLTNDDPIIGKTGSIGIPEFGTAFTRQMLVDTQPKGFDTLVRLSGFSHGTDVWLGNAKDLILSGTADINQTIGCRDDIMLYLIDKGMDEKMAFKIMEAVRKGRVKKGGFQPGWEEEMVRLGVPEWYITSCRTIAYLFPKAHAVAYVMMAFRIAWFKVHEPLAFYAAYFYRRSQKDSFDAAIMTKGIDTVRAKINEIKNNPDATAKEQDLYTTLEACYEFYLRGFSFSRIDLYESDAVKFKIVGNTLRPPFVAIAGLGETAARDLVKCREGGRRFISIEEVQANCAKVSQTHLEQLKAIGALGDMPDTSQISLF
ncbi:MAG: PolC-type DNA polymerase III [Oscillospiraceae bacterium]